jgi:hypothetical protein
MSPTTPIDLGLMQPRTAEGTGASVRLYLFDIAANFFSSPMMSQNQQIKEA